MRFPNNQAAVIAAMLATACAPAPRDVEASVRSYMQTVARDVTAEGPGAWDKHFSESPAFFMASEGQMAFANRAAATAAIQELRRTLPGVQLQWGDDLRVDPLGADFAAVGASYHEL